MKLKFLFFAALLLLGVAVAGISGCMTIQEISYPIKSPGAGEIHYNPKKASREDAEAMATARCRALGLDLEIDISNKPGFSGIFKPGNNVSCRGNYCVYVYACKEKPVENLKNKSPRDTQILGIEEAKNRCASLGFKKGSEEFGKCVLQLSK